MAHQKTIESYEKPFGKGEWSFFEKGHEVLNNQRRQLMKDDASKKITINAVYRRRVNDDSDNKTDEPSEVIMYSQTITGYSPIGNKIDFHENADDTSCWFEPTPKRKIQWNPDKEMTEVKVVTGDIDEVKKHYLYKFDKEGINHIKKLIGNNGKRVHFYVADENKTRVVKDFAE